MKKKIIKFSSTWCTPCKTLTPIFNEIKNELKDEDYIFIESDVEEEDELASKYSIRNVPTIVMTDEDGVELKRTIGMKSKVDLTKFIIS